MCEGSIKDQSTEVGPSRIMKNLMVLLLYLVRSWDFFLLARENHRAGLFFEEEHSDDSEGNGGVVER